MNNKSVKVRLQYLKTQPFKHPSYYVIEAIENTLTRHGVTRARSRDSSKNILYRIFNKLGLFRNFVRSHRTAYFAPMMSMAPQVLFPQALWAETIPYMFDTWASNDHRYEKMARSLRMRLIFVTARQSAVRLNARLPGVDVIWMPEAVDLRHYSAAKPLGNRSIDVLELGRRWDHYHSLIVNHCAARGYTHKFEPTRGTLVFENRREFYAGMADTKISVCFPSSLTHPERSGDVETLTHRYLESMACGAVVLGKCPSELYDLFGYNPVVDVEEARAAEQIDDILNNIDDYRPLIERNLHRVREVGSWDVRIATILKILADRGYQAAHDGKSPENPVQHRDFDVLAKS
jgi:hypothetical protein